MLSKSDGRHTQHLYDMGQMYKRLDISLSDLNFDCLATADADTGNSFLLKLIHNHFGPHLNLNLKRIFISNSQW